MERTYCSPGIPTKGYGNPPIKRYYSEVEIEILKHAAIEEFKEQYGIVLVQTTTVKAVVTK